jgi:hypothetical protein
MRGLKGEEEPVSLSQGTVGCVCLDQWGNLAVATSTGGMTNKLPGLVADHLSRNLPALPHHHPTRSHPKSQPRTQHPRIVCRLSCEIRPLLFARPFWVMIPPGSWILGPRRFVILITLLLHTIIGGLLRCPGLGMGTRSFGFTQKGRANRRGLISQESRHTIPQPIPRLL